MSADLSRVRLDPLLDYAGVRLQQGAVLLDADFNELGDIVDRRLRALASDILGRATVSSTTPDAFKLTLVGGALAIGRGRLYVDGLLAENHGTPSAAAAERLFDPLLGEPQFATPTAYTAQPYLPDPPALPTSGRHLVYLDVWTRELTALDRPDLVESAVGVATSARTQTVWQVRTLAEEAGNATCASPDADLAGWSGLIAPSAGRLTTGTFEVAAIDDPCELPPTGGYRGLENQLYRVEIHDGGLPDGTATFKWSRENASVGSRVATIVSGGELELETLGRDDVLSIKTGDWVELVDEVRELARQPGELRRVTVDAATRRITFAPALPATMLPPAFPDATFGEARNLRARRWDQQGRIFRTDTGGATVQVADLDAPGASGLIAVPAAGTTLLLENGVTIAFDVAGTSGFRSGDHWTFAARTADASVELLDRAPPRGIHHHFARLGLWDVGAGTITDCRNPWPPATADGHDCSCTACVTPAAHASGAFTIQDAVNQVGQTGGTVCLAAGQYALRQPVQITGLRAVRIVGQGAATLIAAAGSAFGIRNGASIGIERMAILSLGRQPAITVETAIGLTLRQLVMAVLAGNDGRAAAIALSGVIALAAIDQNAILAPIGILANDPTASAPETADQPPFLLAAALRITDNILWCQRQGVVLDGRVLHLLDTHVADNDAVGCTQIGISTLGVGLAGSSMTIAGNSLAVTGGGIRCAARGVRIGDNKIARVDRGQGPAIGIALAAGLDKGGIDAAQLLANQIGGFSVAGIAIGTPVNDLIVKLNIVGACANGIVAIDDAKSAAISIENNQLRDIGAEGALVVGIGVTRARAASIVGNTLQAIGTGQVQTALRAGILAFGTDQVNIAGNDVVGVAPSGDFIGAAMGILTLGPTTGFTVTNNHVERDAVPLTQAGAGEWTALAIRDVAVQGQPLHTGAMTTVRLDPARILVLGGGRPYVATAANVTPAGAPAPGAKGSILGNTLVSRGGAPAVEVTAGECLFNDNRVDAQLNGKVAVRLTSPLVMVSANRVTGNELSIQIDGATAKTAAILGNITTRAISLSGGPVPAPWNALNLQA